MRGGVPTYQESAVVPSVRPLCFQRCQRDSTCQRATAAAAVRNITVERVFLFHLACCRAQRTHSPKILIVSPHFPFASVQTWTLHDMAGRHLPAHGAAGRRRGAHQRVGHLSSSRSASRTGREEDKAKVSPASFLSSADRDRGPAAAAGCMCRAAGAAVPVRCCRVGAAAHEHRLAHARHPAAAAGPHRPRHRHSAVCWISGGPGLAAFAPAGMPCLLRLPAPRARLPLPVPGCQQKFRVPCTHLNLFPILPPARSVREFFEVLERKRVVSGLHIACSRDEGAPCRYVQDSMRLSAAELVRYVLLVCLF